MYPQILLVLTLIHGGIFASQNVNLITAIDGSCIPTRWYYLGPCQYCYCKQAKGLTCYSADESLSNVRVGNVQLTLCEPNLKERINEIAQDHNIARTKKHERVSSDNSEEHIKPRLQFPGFGEDDLKKNMNDDDDEDDSAPIIEASLNVEDKPANNDEKRIQNKEDKSVNILNQSDNVNDIDDKHTIDDSAEIEDKTRKFFDNIDYQHIMDTMNLVLRKSLISVKPGNDCVPGTSSYIDNVLCFCMKNGKIICRNN